MGAPVLDMPKGAASTQLLGAAIGPQQTPLEEALLSCRRWLLQAHCLLSAQGRLQNGSTNSCPGHPVLPQQYKPTGTFVRNAAASVEPIQRSQTPPPCASVLASSNSSASALPTQSPTTPQHAQHNDHSPSSPSTTQILDLYAKGLTAAVASFIELSESSQWHVPPYQYSSDHSTYTPQRRNWRTTTLSQYTWTQIIESGVLIKTGQVLELFRAPHVYPGPIQRTVHTTAATSSVQLQVHELHETILHAYSIFISGISLAPVHLWRPLLKQMLEPQANGFLLLLTDCVRALVQSAEIQPRLFAARNRLDDVLHPPSPRMPTQQQHPNPLATCYSPPMSPVAAYNPVGQQFQHCPRTSTLHPASVSSSGAKTAAGMQQQQHVSAGVLAAAAVQATDTQPTADRSSSGVKVPPLLLATRSVTPPASPLLTAHRTQTAAAATTKATASPTSGLQSNGLGTFHSYISRQAAVWLLRILRDINELGTKELSLRRAGVSGPRGLTSVHEFLASLVDLRAGLAGALHELNTLSRFADIYRLSTEAGVPHEDLLPLLEGLVAVACTSCSPDLPLPGDNQGRRGQQTGDVRLYSSALQPHVMSLLTDQLHEVLHNGLADQLRMYADRPLQRLPAALQAQLRLLLRLCECMITLGGASLPAHHVPHMSDVSATHNGGAGPKASSMHSPEDESPSSRPSFSNHSIVHTMSRSHLSMRPLCNDSMSDCDENEGDGEGDNHGITDDGSSMPRHLKQHKKNPKSPLTVLVHDLLGAVHIFCQFAQADAPFFATSADSWLPTLKTLARRLACEGHADLVQDVTLTLCEAATSMTAAMRHAAAAAAQADQQAQRHVISRLKKRLAVGLGVAGDMQTVVLARVGKRRCHPDRPYGWGAGAVDPDAHDPSHTSDSSAATLLAHQTTLGTPRAGAPLSPSQGRPLSASSLYSNSEVPDPVALSSPCVTPRGVRSGIAALMVPSFKYSDSQPRTPRDPAGQGNGSTKKKSPFAAVWEALGYNAHGEPKEGEEADDSGGEEEEEEGEGEGDGLPPWKGLPRQCVMHYEQVLQNVLQALLQLTRGFLLPLHWGVVPGNSTAGTPTTPRSMMSPPAQQRASNPHRSTSQTAAAASTQCAGFGRPPAAASFSQRSSHRMSLLLAGGGTSPMAAALLGPRLFQPGSDASLSEDDMTGDSPPGLLPLFNSMVRAGLLQALESLFTAELLSDQLYRSHAAAVDVSLRVAAQAKGRGVAQVDALRLTATQLLRDVFTSCPQLAADRQGAGALCAVRKFLTLQLHVTASTTNLHPLAQFTKHANNLTADLTSTLRSVSGAAANRHSPTRPLPCFSTCGLPTHPHPHSHDCSALPRLSESHQLVGSVQHGLNSDSHDAHVLTSYCAASLMAISLELLPVPRLVALRAAHDYEPGSAPPGTPGWVPNANSVLAAGLTLLHTWPPILSLLLSLFHTVTTQYSSCQAAITNSSLQTLKSKASGQQAVQSHNSHLQPGSPTLASPSGQKSVPGSPSVLSQHTSGTSTAAHGRHVDSPNSQSGTHVPGTAGRSARAQATAGHPTQHGLALVTRLLPKLRRLLEAWLQQACQLQQLHPQMEVLQSCFEMALVHGGAPRLIESILAGRHFSLATRAQLPDSTYNTPRTSCISTLTSYQSQSNTRDISRHYKLSGLSLVPFEELLTILHQMISPRTALQLVNTQLLPVLASLVTELHDKHLEAVQAVQAVRRLMSRKSSVYHRAQSPERQLSQSPSLARKPSQPLGTDPGAAGKHADQQLAGSLKPGDSVQQAVHAQTQPPSISNIKSRGRSTVVINLPSDAQPDMPSSQSLASHDVPSINASLTNAGTSVLAKSPSVSPSRADRGSAFAQRDIQLQSFRSSMGTRSDGPASCVMERAGHWVLCSSSILKRVAAGVAVATSQLASARLGILSVAASAEKYTAGQPAATDGSGLQTAALPSKGATGNTTSGNRQAGYTQPYGSSRTPASPNQAATTAAMVASGQLNGLSMQALLQHCRAVLISCKSSGGVGVEITQALATLPGILDVAAQLRTAEVTLMDMSDEAMSVSRLTGADVAASLVTYLDPARSRSIGRMSRRSRQASQRQAQQTQQSPARKAGTSITLPPALVPAAASATSTAAHSSAAASTDIGPEPSRSVSLARSGLSMLGQRQSTLRIQLPDGHSTSTSSDGSDSNSNSDGDHGPMRRSESSDGCDLHHSPMRSAVEGRGGLLSSGEAGWDQPRVSVLLCANPADTLWLQEERIKQQKHHLQRAAQLLGHANSALSQLPTPHPCTAIAAFVERPYLMGCCNLACINNVPGGREHEVVLRRCDQCQRIWYCCEQCKLDNWAHHMVACHFSAALVSRG